MSEKHAEVFMGDRDKKDIRRSYMLTEERFAAILEELRTKNAVSVTELVDKLGASELSLIHI